MVQILYSAVLLTLLSFIFYRWICRDSKGKKVPTNWPIIGWIPTLLANLHRLHDFMADLLVENGGTFRVKSSWLPNGGMLVTCDPANVQYILSKKFPNFTKGPHYKKIFADLGDGIFNAEGESWEFQRKNIHVILHHQGFLKFMVTSTWNKIHKGMIPLLDHFAKLGMNVDLQDLIQRFAFDLTCVVLLDYDPVSLSSEFPKFPFKQAFTDAEEGVLYRHIVPETIRKLQQWLQIGQEVKLNKAAEIIDEFLANHMVSKREKLKNLDNVLSVWEGAGFDFLTGYMKLLEEKTGTSDIPDRIWRDSMFNFIFAGKETFGVALTWFFWLMAANPDEQDKIREEILRNLNQHEVGGLSMPKIQEMNKLIYLQGAISETLRLFPSVPLQHKAPTEADILPSGHRLRPNTTTIISIYSMGRMETIWGKDCLEFKPSRWISEQGGIKHVPSYKFTTFNAGPRSCLGKEMSFIQMKLVAVALIYHFEFKLVEGQSVLPSTSVILHMKNGLKVNVSRRPVHH